MIPRVFLNAFEKIEHNYLAWFSKYNFKQTPAFINYANFSIFCRDHNYGIELYQRLEKHLKPSHF